MELKMTDQIPMRCRKGATAHYTGEGFDTQLDEPMQDWVQRS